MSIFDLASGLCYISHALGAEFIELCIRSRLVVTFLVCCRVEARIRSDDVVFQLSHGLEFHSGHILESLACLLQRMLRRAFKRLAVLVEI